MNTLTYFRHLYRINRVRHAPIPAAIRAAWHAAKPIQF